MGVLCGNLLHSYWWPIKIVDLATCIKHGGLPWLRLILPEDFPPNHPWFIGIFLEINHRCTAICPQAVLAVLDLKRTLLLLATGSGKSLCYQLPAYLSLGHVVFSSWWRSSESCDLVGKWCVCICIYIYIYIHNYMYCIHIIVQYIMFSSIFLIINSYKYYHHHYQYLR